MATTRAPRRTAIVLDGSGVDVGFSIDLTIDPALQALAQKTAACYTGRQAACRALGLHRQADKEQPLGEPLLEGAMVRMAAVAVIDVASGRIEALAGALSPCARQEVDGPGRDKSCDPRLPYPVQYRPDALLNPAVFHDAMPASTIKPIMAAAFLSDPEVGARWLAAEQAAMKKDAMPTRDSLRGQLMRSDSARFLDRMFCSEKAYAGCRRPWQVQAEASAFGWNAGCADARSDCGKRDLLSGAALGSCRRARHGRRADHPGRLRPADERAARRQGRRGDAPDEADGARSRHRPPLRRRRRRAPPAATTTGRSAAAARSSTPSPRAGARAMRAPARSASPA